METTYKIIGTDGIEYGPVPLAELKFWVEDGRVALQTHVWRSDSARWMPAGAYPELAPEIGELVAAPAENGLALVGFWPRLFAHLIDMLLLNAASYAVMGAPPQIKFDPAALPDLEALLRTLAPFLAVSLGLHLLYHVSLNGQFGATLGKMAIGARIVNLDGSRLGFGRAFLRWLALFLSQLTLGFGYLLIALREDKRALHDLLAGTRVVYRG